MCEPISMAILSTGLGIASSVGQFQQQGAAAKAQTQYYHQNAANAARAYEIDTRSLTDRQMQEQDQSATKKALQQREFETTRAQAETRASEAGVSGLSLQALMGDLATQQGNRQMQTSENLGDVMNQLQSEKRSQSTNMINRINSVQPGKKPNAMGLALQIGGSIIGGANQYMKASA